MISVLLDSSNRDLSVALANEQGIIEQISYPAWQRQSELMIPELEKLLSKNKVSRNDLGEVLVTIGPGSYTGVRIALTIAKVMAFALNIPLFTFSSLHVMKVNDKPTIALINARSNRSYIGVFKGPEVILGDQVMSNDLALEYIKDHPDYLISGELTYLGLEGHTPDIVSNMFELKKSAKKEENILGITPIYLKD